MSTEDADSTEPEVSRVEPGRLEAHVRALEGERHPHASPEALAAAASYIHDQLEAVGLEPFRDVFLHAGKRYENVLAHRTGIHQDRPRVLLGAHYDTVRGTPGADDNASGVAALLECARVLATERPAATIELVAFNLEEQQGLTYRLGSRHHAARCRKLGVELSGALVFEMVGYRDTQPGTQRVPKLIAWKKIPRTGDFLAVTGDGQSRELLREFVEAAKEVGDLPVVPLRSPLRGWLVWQTRLSDNASFWSEGYPSLMITDTAFLRNPHYHRRSDTADTLDYDFMAQITEATLATVRRLAGT